MPARLGSIVTSRPWSSEKPGSAFDALMAPRTNRPAAVSSAMDRATCPTTSAWRKLSHRRRPTRTSRSPSLISVTMSVRASDSAGPRLNATVLRTARPSVAPSTRMSGRASIMIISGSIVPIVEVNTRIAQ
jgi:hypothetical protein